MMRLFRIFSNLVFLFLMHMMVLMKKTMEEVAEGRNYIPVDTSFCFNVDTTSYFYRDSEI